MKNSSKTGIGDFSVVVIPVMLILMSSLGLIEPTDRSEPLCAGVLLANSIVMFVLLLVVEIFGIQMEDNSGASTLVLLFGLAVMFLANLLSAFWSSLLGHVIFWADVVVWSLVLVYILFENAKAWWLRRKLTNLKTAS